MVVFNIKVRPGLANGTLITNRAGIYFDDNPVVMTNEVENIIGFPPKPIIASNNVSLYPSPASNVMSISMNQGAYSSMIITNEIGQTIIQQALINTVTMLDINSLVPGLYYITFKGENGTQIQKFVKL